MRAGVLGRSRLLTWIGVGVVVVHMRLVCGGTCSLSVVVVGSVGMLVRLSIGSRYFGGAKGGVSGAGAIFSLQRRVPDVS